MKFNSYIKDQIDHHAEISPDQLAFTCSDGTSLTYGELKKSANYLASKFSKNSPVLVCLPVGLEQAHILACLLYNQIPALVLPVGTKNAEVLRIIKNYPFTVMITNATLSRKLQASSSEKLFQKEVNLFGQVFSYFLRDSLVSVEFNWLLHTSGSTGDPKMVMMSFENLVKRTLGEIKLFEIKNKSKILNILPFSHDLGFNQLLTSLCSGSTLEIFTKKLPFEFVQRIAKGDFDGITGMPQIWKNFIQIVTNKNLEINYSGYITVSGGSMPEEHLMQLKNIFKRSKIYKTYGQTETFRTFAEHRQDQILANSCGVILTGVEVCLFNENNQLCEVDETGQLVHCGDGVMSGYWMDVELTKTKLHQVNGKNAVFTGDYFKRLPDNSYQYIGRKDDMVKHAGRRFFLGEIESCLMKSEYLKDICVIHKPDEQLAGGMDKEKLIAFVIPHDKNLDLRKLKEYSASFLEIFKVPDEFIICENFPQTESKKIDRKALVEILKMDRN